MRELPTPLLSIVIPTRNRPSLLARSLRSVLAQNFTDCETVVVDDGSCPLLTLDESVLGQGCITLLRHLRNRGVSAARNSGIAAARGEWVLFLDDDDELLPRSLEAIAARLSNLPATVGFTWGGIERWYAGRNLGTIAFSNSRHADFEHLRIGTGHALTVRRRLLVKIGGFDESLRAGVDFELLIRLGQLTRGVPIRSILVRVHAHEGPRVTDSSPAKAKAFMCICHLHKHFLNSNPGIGIPVLLKSARLLREAGLCMSSRRLALRALSLAPSDVTVWKSVVAQETSALRMPTPAQVVRRFWPCLVAEDASNPPTWA